jgi:hypothetical protein
VIAGLALITVGNTFHGLLRGLFQGAGVAMVLIGVAVLSASRRRRGTGDQASDQTGDQGMWLPSRDEDRQ